MADTSQGGVLSTLPKLWPVMMYLVAPLEIRPLLCYTGVKLFRRR